MNSAAVSNSEAANRIMSVLVGHLSPFGALQSTHSPFLNPRVMREITVPNVDFAEIHLRPFGKLVSKDPAEWQRKCWADGFDFSHPYALASAFLEKNDLSRDFPTITFWRNSEGKWCLAAFWEIAGRQEMDAALVDTPEGSHLCMACDWNVGCFPIRHVETAQSLCG